MNFLQPWLLAGLPLVALPVVIHLINQRRYQTVRWAAMMFLLAANRMSRGYARLRQWLIMAFRMAAIAALIFAISRPLAGGWVGLTAGGRADTTIVLLDRSPSMQQAGAAGSGSKLETGRRQLAAALKSFGSARWVLLEGGNKAPREMPDADALLTATAAGPVSAPADIPGLLEAARDYIAANKPGRTEVWICSDVRQNDWNPESGRWRGLREAFLEFPQGVRFHLLAFPKTSPDNLSVRVTNVKRRKSGEAAELLVSLILRREGRGGQGEPVAAPRETIPVRFEIAGASSEVAVDMAGPVFELRDHRIPIAGKVGGRGWGKVSIPADSNPADNEFYFAFDEPAPRKAVIVTEDPQAARPLQLSASVAPDPAVKCSAEVVSAEQLAAVDWETISLLLWQAPLPEGDAAKVVNSFLGRGGRVIFFPPRSPGATEFLGARWKGWTEQAKELPVEGWRGDQDLLANTQSGAALPVGQLQVRRSCGLSGEYTTLASLPGGDPLLARVTTNAGGAYFCGTTPAVGDSSLSTNGVVLYVLVQRAEAAGAEALEGVRQLDAGTPPGPTEDPSQWKRLAASEEAVSTDFPIHRGVYASGDRLLAVNRPAAEDAAAVLADERVAGLFQGLDFARVDDEEGSLSSLIQEVWRPFLAAMLVAMVVEAALCLPRPASHVPTGMGTVPS